VEPSIAGRVEYLVGLVVGESHGLAERDTCYFTAASAAASAAVSDALAAVGATIAAVAAAATIAISVVATIAISIAAIYCCHSLVDCLVPVEGCGSKHHGSSRLGSERSILDNVSLF
jgi:hypothetical protein